MKKLFLFLSGWILILNIGTNSYALSNDHYQQIPMNASADQLSLPLMVASMENNGNIYRDLLSRMLKALTTSLDHPISNDVNSSFSYQTWLLGRVLLASKYINDYATSEKISALMLGLLQNNNTIHDEFYAWAWAYLVSYYADQPEFYNKYKIDMFNAADYYVTHNPTQIENIVWIRVMELQAVASAKDDTQYQVILQAIKQNTKKSTVLNALDIIPLEDYQAWAKAIVMNAAARVDDGVTYNIMKNATEKAIILSNEDNNLKALDSVELAKLISQNAIQYKETLFTETKSSSEKT